MMNKLTIEDLFSPEVYLRKRLVFRQVVMEHKKNRRIHLGPNLTLHFEDNLTMKYQVQEMIRAEKIAGMAEIDDELETYNALIPDGSNWKATLMIEFTDELERQDMLMKLTGIENKIWIKIGDNEKVYPVADEDMQRSTQDKTSAVHFLRFELDDEMISSLRGGGIVNLGSDHELYSYQTQLNQEQKLSLRKDLE